MSLYQILSINEKQQNVDLNVWAIQKWNDDFLGWNPYLYGMINTTILPFDAIWLPDTYLYNRWGLMNYEKKTERYINVVVTTSYWKGEKGAEVKFMYPALFFPYGQQACKLTISSWTSSKSDINYEPEYESEKFVCCPEPWVLLEAVLVVRRKPLYYIVNLVIPTSVITLVAVTGFFTAASTSSERREKLSLGIDSLLAMSILMMMVSEQMPTSSDFVPLFGIFYLSIIFIIFIGTLFTAFILNVHLQKMYAKPVSPIVSYIFFGRVSLLLPSALYFSIHGGIQIAQWLRMRPPTMLLELWNETGVTFGKKYKMKAKRMEMKNQKMPKVTSSSSGLNLLKSNSGAICEWKGNCFRWLTRLEDRSFEKSNNGFKNQINTQKSMDDMKREAARRNWRRLVKKINSNKQNGVKNCGDGERGQLRQAGRKKVPAAISVPHGEPGPLMLSASAISAFSVTGDSTILESKLKRRYALEWEYLASVLDRVLLIVFSLVVFTVTSVMILVGEAMHLSYELAAKEF
ncbi:hypothetical protein CRE_22231 [Caenorhabditis remanei]|uniref:Uncharacterized protein n=1 Tax=Caenorhabditis remanei TaxID=31234 RepID=E3NRG4_CAERE|nr:hypothetical protein CRE_22231 [Caenorhabditis remanei]